MRYDGDYILRQVERLAELLANALRTGKPADVEQAQAEIDQAYGRLLNMDRTMFRLLDAGQVVAAIGDERRLCQVVEVMRAEGDLRWHAGHRCPDDLAGEVDRAKAIWKRALVMLEIGAHDQDGLASALRQRIDAGPPT